MSPPAACLEVPRKGLRVPPEPNPCEPLGGAHAPAVAHAAAEAIPRAHPRALVPEQLLDGDEIVILALKPSLWYVLIVSFPWVAGVVLLTAAIGRFGLFFDWITTRTAVQALVAVAGLRLGVAVLQWVSRLYVLTNRRVMRVRGVFNVDLFEAPLTRLQNTFVSLTWYERLLGLGSIGLATAGTGAAEAWWEYVARPLEIHDRLRQAIREAQGTAGV